MSRANWLDWRRKGIGASDSPAIMGVSPYKTALQIYADKISTEPPVEMSSRIMEKGNELEPIARRQFAAHYNLQNGTDETFEPLLVQLEELPFMRASLDGASKDKKIIVEIKFQGKEKHLAVAKGEVRIDYWTQIQHQFICSGAEQGFLVSINEASTDKKLDVLWCEVKPDKEYQKKHLRACIEFWDCVANKRPPGASADDFVTLTGMDKVIEEWKTLTSQAALLQDQADKLKEEILAKVSHPKMKACGVSITQVERAGTVDYKKIPELKGIDLEKYRKASTQYYKMTIDKE